MFLSPLTSRRGTRHHRDRPDFLISLRDHLRERQPTSPAEARCHAWLADSGLTNSWSCLVWPTGRSVEQPNTELQLKVESGLFFPPARWRTWLSRQRPASIRLVWRADEHMEMCGVNLQGPPLQLSFRWKVSPTERRSPNSRGEKSGFERLI